MPIIILAITLQLRFPNSVKDRILKSVLEGTRQLEWDASIMSFMVGLLSCMAYLFSGNESSYGKISVIGVSVLQIICGISLMLALLCEDKAWCKWLTRIHLSRTVKTLQTPIQRRCWRARLTKFIALLWIARGLASILANFPRSIFVPLTLFTVFFFVKASVAHYHNSLVLVELKHELDKCTSGISINSVDSSDKQSSH